MTKIRNQIDPENTLPQVELKSVKRQEWDSLIREDELIIVNGEAVGTCTIVTQDGYLGEHKVHFDGIELAEDAKNKGIGMATYLLAIEYAQKQGLPFETQDDTQSENAVRVWERLANLGVAEVVTPFYPSIKPGKFEGKYRIPVEKD